ncbi:MAG: DUF3488 domain-containing protein [Candidatus Latescibacteria bacterium]|nr:DUF3488 domain-containing protein [Candidatus Latescibacterota bacterium]
MSAAIKRAQLSYTELCQLKWMLGGLLTLVSLWTLLYVEVRSGLLVGITGAAILCAMAWPFWTERIPDLVWKFVTPALFVIITTDFLLSRPDIIPPLVRMIILLVLVRSVQGRRRREDLQLILLCLFMVMVAGVLTLSLTFGVQIFVFTPLAMGLLFLITLTENYERNGLSPARLWGAFRWDRFLSRIWQAQDFRLFAIAAGLFAGVMVVTSLIFVLMPRFRLDQAIPFLNVSTTRSKAGFSDRIEFGDVVDIIADESIALRVDLTRNVEKPDSPYWRMVVLDEYDNGAFQVSASARSSALSFSRSYFRVPDSPEEIGKAGVWTFYFEGGISKFLPAVGLLRSLRFQNRQSVEFNDLLQTVNTARIHSKVLFYQVESLVQEDSLPGAAEDRNLIGKSPLAVEMSRSRGTPFIPYPYTTLVVPGGPRNIETLSGIVREITGDQPLSAREFSARATAYLQQRHRYSLSSTIPTGDSDPLVRWLDSDQPGHCELFAGAFVLLGRRAGYPTRIVTGFKGGAWNGYENYYMVRNKNAHAWCEVFDGYGFWFRVDPTPGLDPAATDGTAGALSMIDRTWRAYLDSLRILWYRRIVNFNQEQQRELAGQLREASVGMVDTLRAGLRSLLASARAWIASLWSGSVWLLALRLLVLMGALWVVVRWLPRWIARLVRETGRRFGVEWSSDPIRQKAGRLLVRFRTTSPSRIPTGPMPPEEWDTVYRDLLTLRFGSRAQWPDPDGVFHQARGLLKRQLS